MENNKMINIKVFISGELDSYNLQINKNEKISNIKNIIAENLNENPNDILIECNNKNMEEIQNSQNEILINLIGRSKIPYFKVYYKNQSFTKKNFQGKIKLN
jgi:hypothetical protein